MKYPIEIELTDICLLNCRYCPNHTYKDKWFISEYNFNLLLNYLSKNIENILFLDLSWIWDIFLHPKIEKFLILLSEKFSKTDLQILIPTKWNSINNNHLKLLKKISDDWLKINISIWFYSLRKEIHDTISWVNNFQKLINTIKKLKKFDIGFTLELLINKYSFSELWYLNEFSNKLWVNYKVHNYHNFWWLINDNEFENYNSKQYKLNCSFADEENYEYGFHCSYTMPFISKNWYLYYCTHWGKQEKFKIDKIEKLFNKFPNYEDLLNYIKKTKNISICKNCTYMKNNKY